MSPSLSDCNNEKRKQLKQYRSGSVRTFIRLTQYRTVKLTYPGNTVGGFSQDITNETKMS